MFGAGKISMDEMIKFLEKTDVVHNGDKYKGLLFNSTVVPLTGFIVHSLKRNSTLA